MMQQKQAGTHLPAHAPEHPGSQPATYHDVLEDARHGAGAVLGLVDTIAVLEHLLAAGGGGSKGATHQHMGTGTCVMLVRPGKVWRVGGPLSSQAGAWQNTTELGVLRSYVVGVE